MIEEQWLPVVGWESHYAVSSLGRIKRTSPGRGPTFSGKILAGGNAKGYRMLKLTRPTKTAYKTAHSMVLEAFIGPRPTGYQANHKDGNRLNNCLENLEWITASGNMLHSFRVLGNKAASGNKNGMRTRPDRTPQGMRNGQAKLTEANVRQILAAHGHFTRRALAQKYQVSVGTIDLIRARKVWAHIIPWPTCWL